MTRPEALDEDTGDTGDAREEETAASVPLSPRDVLADHIMGCVMDAAPDLAPIGKSELPFEAEQLAVRLLRAAERAQGADMTQDVTAHVRSLLRAVGGPTTAANRITRRICDFLRGADAGRL